MEAIISEYVEEETKILQSLDIELMNRLYESIIKAYQNGGRIYMIGNGGSSANASHWVNDIKKGLHNTNNGFDVICLTDNIPLMTAYANDVSYEDVFYEQIKGQIREEDIIIALSVSGNSRNLVKAYQYAKEVNCTTIAIVADYNGALERYADLLFILKTKNYGIAEDVQQTINHILVQKLKKWQASCEREVLHV